MPTRICSPTKGCGQEKDINEFAKNGKTKNGIAQHAYLCKKCKLKYDRKYISNNPQRRLITRLLSQTKVRHTERGFKDEYDLDKEFLETLVTERCCILGIKLVYYSKSGKKESNSASLDRIDNSKGYIKGNVRFISWRANSLKSDATIEELEKILAYMKEQNAANLQTSEQQQSDHCPTR